MLNTHTDRSVNPISNELIALGLDGRNPGQSYVVDMDRSLLLEEFRPRLSFNECINIQRYFSFSTLEEIKLEVNKTEDALG